MDRVLGLADLFAEKRVGPKGYVHGWIFVGVPGIGADVIHPEHGHGVVTGASGGRVSVKFDNGASREFEHGGGHGRPEFVPRPAPAIGTPEHAEMLKQAGESNARGQSYMSAKAAAGRTWIHEATGLPTDLVTKLARSAPGEAAAISTADRLFHEGDLSRAATLLDAIADRERNKQFGRNVKDIAALEAAAKRIRSAKVKDVPSGLGSVGRNPDGSIIAVDNKGREYTVRLSADKKTVTVTGPGGTVSGPAGDNPTSAARRLAHEVRGSNGNRTAETPVASTVHHPFGSPSGPGLFHVKGLQLPAYIQNVAHAFTRKGIPESEAIQRAVGVVRDWAAGRTPNGKGRVHPDVQAAAAKAIAEWEAAKAAAHSRTYEGNARMTAHTDYRAEMSAADQNDLPDDAFAYIEPGGTKDGSGKTVPRSKRHFPIHDAAHVRNALSRAPQSPFGDKALPAIKAAAKKFGIDSDGDAGRSVLADEEIRELRLTSQYKGLDSRLEIRTDSDGQWVGGYASVFQPRESRNLGGFIERVAPHAFNEARATGWGDVVCRFNHDSNYVLGTAAAGTLRLRTDNVGLDYQVLPPQAEERIRELVARGDIRYSSFAFRCRPGGDEWGITDQNFPMRTLHDVELVDVAPVLTPAYPDATAAVRATAPALRSLADHMQITVDEVRGLADADELRRLFIRTDKPIYRPEPKKLFGPAAAAMLLARRTDPFDQA